MTSDLTFETARLQIENWEVILSDSFKREKLEQELNRIITSKVTHRLPLSMQFSAEHDSISKWIDARANETEVLCAHARDTAALVGLILLFKNPEKSEALTVQLGYFFGEPNWGKGYATEMITGLITAIKGGLQARLVAGVDRDNAASVGVLEKSGFKKIPEQTTAGRYYFEIDVM